MRIVSTLASALLALTAASSRAPAQTPDRPDFVVVRDARLSDAKDAPKAVIVVRDGRIEGVLPPDAESPRGARIVDAHGALALPAFVDAYSFAGFEMPKPVAARDLAPATNADVLVDMRDANRKGILAAFKAADAFRFDEATDERYRASGFGTWLAAPHGELLSGTSALVSSRRAAARDRVRKAYVFAHGGFDCSGPGYPGTLMGSIAQLRQFFLDAQWARELEARENAGKPGRRAPYDADLAAAQALLERKARLVCEAETAADIERWIALADAFGLDIAISGGREAWRRASVLAQRKIPVILTLEWGDEVPDPHAKDKAAKPDGKGPKKRDGAAAGGAKNDATTVSAEPSAVKPTDAKSTEAKPIDAKPNAEEPAKTGAAPSEAPKAPSSDEKAKGADDSKDDDAKRWIYEEPMRVKEEKRRLWLESRDCALRLNEAGVTFVFGSAKDAPKELLDRVRVLVENGLPRDVAERALTTTAAELLGVGAALGRIERGRDASFGLWSAHPLSDKEARLVWLFVEGAPREFEVDKNELKGKPDEGVDLSGTWTLTFESADVKPARIELDMQRDGATKGVLRFKSPFDDTDLQGDVQGRVAGRKLRLTGRVQVGTFESEVSIEGALEGAALKGSTTWKWSGGENTSSFHAERAPQELHEEGDGLDRDEDHCDSEPRAGGGR